MSRVLEYQFDYDGYGRGRDERDTIIAEAVLTLRERGELSDADEITDITVRGGHNTYKGPVEVTIE